MDFAEPAPEDGEIRASLLGAGRGRGFGANDPHAIHALGHQRCFEDAIAAIRAGRPPMVDGPEARKAVTIIEAIYQSAREGGRKIKVAAS